MNKATYRHRIIDDKVETYLRTFGAVCIEGPKWCGKTWTSSYHSNSEFFLGDPAGNFQNKKLAEMSPDLILNGESPRLIDEWQEVPTVWDAVRYRVDQTAQKGQFILTGSSTPNHKGIIHSGAGRIARLHMRSMSLYESGDSTGAVSLESLCHGDFTPAMTGEVDLRNLITYIIRGGWGKPWLITGSGSATPSRISGCHCERRCVPNGWNQAQHHEDETPASFIGQEREHNSNQ